MWWHSRRRAWIETAGYSTFPHNLLSSIHFDPLLKFCIIALKNKSDHFSSLLFGIMMTAFAPTSDDRQLRGVPFTAGSHSAAQHRGHYRHRRSAITLNWHRPLCFCENQVANSGALAHQHYCHHYQDSEKMQPGCCRGGTIPPLISTT